MNYTKIQIIAAVDTELGIVELEPGVLTIVVKAPNEKDWPHGIIPTSGQNRILEGSTRYVIFPD